MKLFVPFSEDLVEETGVVGRLVPFQLEYECVRLHGWESVEVLPTAAISGKAAPAEQLQAT
jgi:hypothetical protein